MSSRHQTIIPTSAPEPQGTNATRLTTILESWHTFCTTINMPMNGSLSKLEEVAMRKRIEATPPTTAEVITLAQAGDSEAFERLVAPFLSSIRSIARRLHGPSEVDDMTQEVLLKLYLLLHRFDVNRAEKLKSWMLTLARNVCIDQLKKSPAPTAVAWNDETITPLDLATNPLDAVVNQEKSGVLEREIADLPEWYREAFCGREIDHQPYAVIARECGVTELNVRARVSRAKARLRKRLEILVAA